MRWSARSNVFYTLSTLLDLHMEEIQVTPILPSVSDATASRTIRLAGRMWAKRSEIPLVWRVKGKAETGTCGVLPRQLVLIHFSCNSRRCGRFLAGPNVE